MQLGENVVVADRFRLIRMIGRGGMGSVWQATHISLDQPCAVKFIEGDLGNVADAHARFEREAKAAAQLRSPHVVQIIDHGVWEGRPYIAMELLEGEDLGKTIQKAGGKLQPAYVANIMQQVCRALTKAHQAGIVHRDLKPDNIFLVNDDDRQLVKILDFGVAKQTSQAIDGSNTKTGAMLGTPYYMSPEQAQGIKTVDSRSDLWSLAVIVYQCLTGRLPFESEALGDLLVKIIVNPIPTPSQVAPVPPGFDAWWAKAAQRPPENRYPTAKDFANALAVAVGVSAQMTDITGRLPASTAMMQQSPYQQPGTPTAALQQSGAPIMGHPLNTPVPSNFNNSGAPAMMAASGSPATFSGVEPPAGIPAKKGPPMALILGIAGAFLVLAVVGTVLVVKSKTTASGTGPTPSAGTSVAVTPSALPSTTATEAPSATPSATVATPEPSAEPSATPSAVAAKPTATTQANPPGGGGNVPAKVVPTTKPSSAAAPSASAKPKWNAGF